MERGVLQTALSSFAGLHRKPFRNGGYRDRSGKFEIAGRQPKKQSERPVPDDFRLFLNHDDALGTSTRSSTGKRLHAFWHIDFLHSDVAVLIEWKKFLRNRGATRIANAGRLVDTDLHGSSIAWSVLAWRARRWAVDSLRLTGAQTRGLNEF